MTKGKLTPDRPRPTSFDSWRTAFVWAFHIARVGQVKTTVKKIDGRWSAYRQPPAGDA